MSQLCEADRCPLTEQFRPPSPRKRRRLSHGSSPSAPEKIPDEAEIALLTRKGGKASVSGKAPTKKGTDGQAPNDQDTSQAATSKNNARSALSLRAKRLTRCLKSLESDLTEKILGPSNLSRLRGKRKTHYQEMFLKPYLDSEADEDISPPPFSKKERVPKGGAVERATPCRANVMKGKPSYPSPDAQDQPKQKSRRRSHDTEEISPALSNEECVSRLRLKRKITFAKEDQIYEDNAPEGETTSSPCELPAKRLRRNLPGDDEVVDDEPPKSHIEKQKTSKPSATLTDTRLESPAEILDDDFVAPTGTSSKLWGQINKAPISPPKTISRPRQLEDDQKDLSRPLSSQKLLQVDGESMKSLVREDALHLAEKLLEKASAGSMGVEIIVTCTSSAASGLHYPFVLNPPALACRIHLVSFGLCGGNAPPRDTMSQELLANSTTFFPVALSHGNNGLCNLVMEWISRSFGCQSDKAPFSSHELKRFFDEWVKRWAIKVTEACGFVLGSDLLDVLKQRRVMEQRNVAVEMVDAQKKSVASAFVMKDESVEPVVSVRIAAIDFYMAQPNPHLDRMRKLSSKEGQTGKERETYFLVPTIRIFGSTRHGQKACLHVHQVFPYLYIPYDGSMEHVQLHEYIAKLRSSLDLAMNLARGTKTKSSKSRVFIAGIIPVKGIPFYGYHVGYQYFLKIYLYNPVDMKKVTAILASGGVMQRKFQPYESHIPYLAQFFIDFNLLGMDFIDLIDVRFRHEFMLKPPVSLPRDPNRHITESNTPDNLKWPSSSRILRQSYCELEMDCWPSDILNRARINERPNAALVRGNHDADDVKIVPSLATLWKEEEKRFRAQGGTGPLVKPSNDERNESFEPWFNESRDMEHIRKVLASAGMDERRSQSYLQQVSSIVNDGVMTAFQSILALTNERAFDEEPTEVDFVVDEGIIHSQMSMIEDEEEQQHLDDDNIMGDVMDDMTDEPPAKVWKGKGKVDHGAMDIEDFGKDPGFNLAEATGAFTQTIAPEEPFDISEIILQIERQERAQGGGPSRSKNGIANLPQFDGTAGTGISKKRKRKGTADGSHMHTKKERRFFEFEVQGNQRISTNSSQREAEVLNASTSLLQSRGFMSTIQNMWSPERENSSSSFNLKLNPRSPTDLRSPSSPEMIPDSPKELNEAVAVVAHLAPSVKPSTVHWNDLPESPSAIPDSPDVILATPTSSQNDANAPDDSASPKVLIPNMFKFANPRRRTFDYRNHEYVKSSDAVEVIRHFNRTAHPLRPRIWTTTALPPSRHKVEQWLGRNPLPPTPKYLSHIKPKSSQIDGPTPANKHGFKYSQIQTDTLQHEMEFLTILSLEVFALCPEDYLPNPETDAVTCIFYCFATEEQLVFEQKDFDQDGLIIDVEESEKNLFDKLIGIVRGFDPDILAGYEVHSSSWVIFATAHQRHTFARVYGMDFYSVIWRGSQFRVESIMARITRPENFIMFSPNAEQLYTDPVLVHDFQSLYPSVMIGYNFCTCIGRVSYVGKKATLGVNGEFEVPLEIIQVLQDDLTIAPNGVIYVKPHIRRGVLGRMLNEVLDTRVMALLRILDARQLSLKLLANVTYGYAGASFSGRMPCSDIADSIVQTGRCLLERAMTVVQRNFSSVARVIYGDTDSMFTIMEGASKETAFKMGLTLVKEVTRLTPPPVKLKFEKTKKRYVGFMYETLEETEPGFDAKGIETVRRDGCPAVAKMVETCLKLLFRTKDLSQIKAYLLDQWTKILEDRVSYQDFIIATEVRMGHYKSLPPGAALTKKKMNQDSRSEPQHNERVPYIIVYGGPNSTLAQQAVTPEEIATDRSLRLHGQYYIKQKIIPPLDRIFRLVGIGKNPFVQKLCPKPLYPDITQWYNDMPKVNRSREGMALLTSKPTIPKPSKITTMEHFYTSSLCLICDKKNASRGICADCRSTPSAAALRLSATLRGVEMRYKNVLDVCRSCTGHSSALDGEVMCASTVCPVYFSRVRALHTVRGMTSVYMDALRQLED
ncbi:hypothetical protein BC829DRAFT_445128 [Chytridium lagenaria]|nr:hypothetical protein BC829DRAFT_445128 [Chytridium lagenaria]